MNTRVIHVADLGQHPDAIYIGREYSGRGRGPSFKRSRFANPFPWTVCGVCREPVWMFLSSGTFELWTPQSRRIVPALAGRRSRGGCTRHVAAMDKTNARGDPRGVGRQGTGVLVRARRAVPRARAGRDRKQCRMRASEGSTMNAITTPALAARVRRRLARERQLLRRCSPWSEQHATLGNYFIVAAHTHDVLARHVNVEELARDLGLLPDHVVVEDDYTHTDGEVPSATLEDER